MRYSIHVIQGCILLDRRNGVTIDRTTFDLVGARTLLEQLTKAVRELEAQGKPA